MLPGDSEIEKLAEKVGPLQCNVELPPTWSDFFERRGVMPTVGGEKRRFPRNYFRVCAALWCRCSLPVVERDNTWHKVYTSNMSRSGIGIVHSEELYPGEQLTLVLPDCRPRCIEVSRCRRIQERCYEIGAMFINTFRGQEESEPEPS